ncbi:MAG: hypothetical protein EOL98_06165 [Negativicutes bacterium]|nr:hypothetical protein [Negativicutes bacterium]
MNKESLLQIQKNCFLLMVAFLPLTNIAVAFPLNIIGGGFANKVSFYPAFFGMMAGIYQQIRFGGHFTNVRAFKRYIAAYFLLLILSTVHGLYIYPFYEESGIANINTLQQICGFIGVYPDNTTMAKFYIAIRIIKNNLLSTVYTFGFSYWIYCLFRDDAKEGMKLVFKGILIAIPVILAYSLVELFYLAGNVTAREILKTVTPYFHEIGSSHNWWPPLLWKNQLRSVFAEPSFFGIYSAFVLPFIWQQQKKIKSVNLFLLFSFTFLLFMTKARTGSLIFLMQLIIFALYSLTSVRKEVIFRFVIVLLCSAAAFASSALFINQFMNSGQAAGVSRTVTTYISDNVESVADPTKRSNQSRYSVIIADLRLGFEHPLLGIGTGLRSAYIPQFFPDRKLQNVEMKNWVRLQKEKGILNSTIPNLCEYSGRFAETGFLGLSIFLAPLFYLFIRMRKKMRELPAEDRDQIFMFGISLLGICASGLSTTFNTTYCYWILLGLGYAISNQSGESKRTKNV